MWMEMSYNQYQDNLTMWQKFEEQELDVYDYAESAFDIFEAEKEDENCL